MGLWKRVSEKTKQSLGLKGNEANWKPTSNARNIAMIEEARKFSKHLKLLHRELRDLESKVEGSLGTFKAVLNSTLPRVHEMTDKGPVPVDKEAAIVGGGVAFEVLTSAAGELKSKLQQEVLHPLDQWQAAYRMIKSRNGKCEELRLELDAKRREAAAITVTLEKQKTKAQSRNTDKNAAQAVEPQPGGSPSKFEDAEFKLQKEEDKVTRLTQRFKDVESEVFDALLTLINDTKVLKQYAAASLVVFQHGFAHAYTAFGAHAPVGSTSSQTAMGLGTPIKSTLSGGGAGVSPGSHGSPGTPNPSTAPIAAPPAPPAWYNEARQQATTMKYDSDDDN